MRLWFDAMPTGTVAYKKLRESPEYFLKEGWSSSWVVIYPGHPKKTRGPICDAPEESGNTADWEIQYPEMTPT